MHTHVKERPLWQKALPFVIAATLAVGLNLAPLMAKQAAADEGAQLSTAQLAGDNTLDANAKATTIKVTTDGWMFAAEKTSQLSADGKTLKLMYDSKGYDYAFMGSTVDADKAAKSKWIPFNDSGSKWFFKLPVAGKTDGKSFKVAFHSKREGKWYQRWMILDADAKSLYVCHTDPKAAAKKVDKLIHAIQVQERTDKTDAQCKKAKEAWDALPKPVRKLMEEYDYFGLNTGKASKDNPLNDNGIGKNEILVVSFGTSYNNSRVATIGGVEKAIQKAFPKWSVRRAFTAQIIINHIQARDNEKIDNMQQALIRAERNGVKNLVVAPTHLMHGAEYDELVAALKPYQKKMNIKISEPLLGEKSKSATKINSDKKTVAKAVVAAAAKDAKYKNVQAMDKDGVALVLMGHGTSHEANVTYTQMQAQMDKLGYKNVFIGTVEGEPEGTECEAIIEKVKAAGYKTVILRPLMVVAGDHANNDMADPDDPESWYSQFKASKAFKKINCQIKGLGQIKDVQKLYVKHVKAAM